MSEHMTPEKMARDFHENIVEWYGIRVDTEDFVKDTREFIDKVIKAERDRAARVAEWNGTSPDTVRLIRAGFEPNDTSEEVNDFDE